MLQHVRHVIEELRQQEGTLKRLEILNKIGSGGYGVVHKGEWCHRVPQLQGGAQGWVSGGRATSPHSFVGGCRGAELLQLTLLLVGVGGESCNSTPRHSPTKE